MSIALGDPRKMPPVRKGEITTPEKEQLRRSEGAAQAFPGRQARGLGLDFNAAPAVAAKKTSGMPMSALDLYTPVTRSDDEVKRAERQEQLDKLPIAVQRLAQTQGVTDLTTLAIVGAVHRKSELMAGEKVQVFASDLAKATGTTTQRAGEILSEAVRHGWLVPGASHSAAGGFFRTNLG
jgi:hypothetical protein